MIVLPRRLSDEVADRVRALIDEKNLEAGMTRRRDVYSLAS